MTHEETNIVEYQPEQKQWDLTVSFIQPGEASCQQSKDWTIPIYVRDQQKQVVLNGISPDTDMEFSNRFISGTGVSDHL